jgi:hypothetical protein
MRKFAVIVALAALVPLAGAFAAGKPGKPDRPRLVCRVAQQTTGSHIRAPRRCHSEEEWARIDEEAGRIPVDFKVNAAKNDGTQTRPQP